MSTLQALVALLLFGFVAAAEDARIVVHADQVSHKLTRYLTGACLEDVNHEIYGGLYSQMIFGESFQEPPPVPKLRGFAAYGGQWLPRGEVLYGKAGDGPKLISEGLALAIGEVGVSVFLPGHQSGNAGLIVKTSDSGVGADKFVGYEISLETSGYVVLGRHRQNWEPLRRVPCEVPADRWIELVVRLAGASLEIKVDGRSILTYEDTEHPLAGGRVGLRTWRRDARFRGLYVKTEGQPKKLPFELSSPDAATAVSGMWQAFRSGSARGEYSLETQHPFIGEQSQRLSFRDGAGEIGIENQGLNRWGMNFVKGKPYEGHVWLRAEKPAEVFLGLEDAAGTKLYAERRVEVKSAEWERISFRLTPKAADRAGRFAIRLKQPGSVCVGYVLLQPGPWGRFKGLPVRKDVAAALQAQGVTVLRYGGSMINHSEYRWKKMIGPADRRPPYHGTWYAHSSNGWGIFDFLNFCEAAGFLGIPAINMNETPADMTDFIAYANGPDESDWGRRRAADGHGAPYGLKQLEIGNEEAINEGYWEKFKPLAESLWAKDPHLILVVGDFAYEKTIGDPYNFAGAPLIKTLAVHKKILDLAREHNREVWFDVHIGTEQPPAPHGVPGVRSFIEQLTRLSPGANFKVAIFELNAGNHKFKRALANACAINQLERIGDRVAIACSANCLQPDKQNDNGWDQGLLFLNPSQVWAQPPYYVTQMLSRNYLPLCVKTEVQSPAAALDVTATRSDDRTTLILQVVNVADVPVPAQISLDGFTPRKPAAREYTLMGDWDAVNTAKQPDHVRPVESTWHYRFKDSAMTYTFPARSFTLLRFD
jgi:alpha-L-arabinofuranosidase